MQVPCKYLTPRLNIPGPQEFSMREEAPPEGTAGERKTEVLSSEVPYSSMLCLAIWL